MSNCTSASTTTATSTATTNASAPKYDTVHDSKSNTSNVDFVKIAEYVFEMHKELERVKTENHELKTHINENVPQIKILVSICQNELCRLEHENRKLKDTQAFLVEIMLSVCRRRNT